MANTPQAIDVTHCGLGSNGWDYAQKFAHFRAGHSCGEAPRRGGRGGTAGDGSVRRRRWFRQRSRCQMEESSSEEVAGAAAQELRQGGGAAATSPKRRGSGGGRSAAKQPALTDLCVLDAPHDLVAVRFSDGLQWSAPINLMTFSFEKEIIIRVTRRAQPLLHRPVARSIQLLWPTPQASVARSNWMSWPTPQAHGPLRAPHVDGAGSGAVRPVVVRGDVQPVLPALQLPAPEHRLRLPLLLE